MEQKEIQIWMVTTMKTIALLSVSMLFHPQHTSTTKLHASLCQIRYVFYSKELCRYIHAKSSKSSIYNGQTKPLYVIDKACENNNFSKIYILHFWLEGGKVNGVCIIGIWFNSICHVQIILGACNRWKYLAKLTLMYEIITWLRFGGDGLGMYIRGTTEGRLESNTIKCLPITQFSIVNCPCNTLRSYVTLTNHNKRYDIDMLNFLQRDNLSERWKKQMLIIVFKCLKCISPPKSFFTICICTQ